jgi:hypothetical protein
MVDGPRWRRDVEVYPACEDGDHWACPLASPQGHRYCGCRCHYVPSTPVDVELYLSTPGFWFCDVCGSYTHDTNAHDPRSLEPSR